MQNMYHRHDISDETWELLENLFPVAKAPGEVRSEIIGNSSTLFSGFCGQVHLGEIFRPITATGRILTGGSAIGEIDGYGKTSLNFA